MGTWPEENQSPIPASNSTGLGHSIRDPQYSDNGYSPFLLLVAQKGAGIVDPGGDVHSDEPHRARSHAERGNGFSGFLLK